MITKPLADETRKSRYAMERQVRRELKAEIDRLLEENAELKAEVARLATVDIGRLRIENAELKVALDRAKTKN
jgi:hypothetical protein